MATTRSLWWVRPRSAATSLPPSARLSLRARASRLRRRRVGAADCDLAAVGEAHKTGRHDALGRLKALADHRLRLVLFLHRYRPYCDGVIIFGDVHKGAAWSSLHRTGRYHHHLF